MNYVKSITKEEINSLPLLEYSGKIELIEDLDHAALCIKQLSTARILGFDTETRPSFNAGQSYQVSLLQLATEECAYLFRLNKLGTLPQGLADVLSNEKIIKAGVAIQDDVRYLQKLNYFQPAGFVDLAKELEKKNFKNFGLRGLTAIFLGKRLSKGPKLTNWDRHTLSEAQINYAANDALVGLLIYLKFITL
jgi:ribonuclease D